MKTLTQTNHMATIRVAYKSQLKRICELLEWTEEQYCSHQFEQYVAFIENMFKHFPIMAKQVLYSPIMCGFWINEANIRNEVYFFPYAISTTATLWVNESGKIFEVEPSCIDVVEEYLHTHHALTLQNDDEFMMKYNRVLETIRKEQQC